MVITAVDVYLCERVSRGPTIDARAVGSRVQHGRTVASGQKGKVPAP